MNKQIIIFLVFIAPSIACAKPIHLIEVISFHCEYCKSMNKYHGNLEKAVSSTGGEFRIAPIPYNIDNVWKERIYYSTRTSPSLEKSVREALFRGTVSFNLSLDNLRSVIDWLRMNITDPNINWHDIQSNAMDNSTLVPISKTVKILNQLTITEVPAFVMVKNGDYIFIPTEGSAENRLKEVLSVIKRASV